jgi:hypothetical protein
VLRRSPARPGGGRCAGLPVPSDTRSAHGHPGSGFQHRSLKSAYRSSRSSLPTLRWQAARSGWYGPARRSARSARPGPQAGLALGSGAQSRQPSATHPVARRQLVGRRQPDAVTPTRPRGRAMRKLMGLSFNCCGCVRAGGPACRLPRSWALDAMLWPAAEMCPAFRSAAAATRPCLLGWPHLLRA